MSIKRIAKNLEYYTLGIFIFSLGMMIDLGYRRAKYEQR